jgi:pimeloyl-ACP methyl ester carboxylesterase
MERATSEDGTTIAFDRSGEGPPIVLVGGALSDRAVTAPLAGHLAPRFTVISYDRRGRGDSGDTAPFAVEREVEDLEAVIQEAGGSAFVFGHSSGGVLALEATRALPDSLTKLALYEPPFVIDGSRPPLPADFVTRLQELTSSDRRDEALEYFLVNGPWVPIEVVETMRREPPWPSLEALAHTLAYDGAIMEGLMSGSPAPLGRWASVATPTLVMDGGESPEWQRNAVRALVAVLPHAHRRTLDGQDHGPADHVLWSALEEFFAG